MQFDMFFTLMAVVTYAVAYVAAHDVRQLTVVDLVAPSKSAELFHTVMYGGEKPRTSTCDYLKFFADFDDNNQDGPAVSVDVAISEFHNVIEVVTSDRNRGMSPPESSAYLTFYISFPQPGFSYQQH